MGDRVCWGSRDDGLAANSERGVLVCWLVFHLAVWSAVSECLDGYHSKIRRHLGLSVGTEVILRYSFSPRSSPCDCSGDPLEIQQRRGIASLGRPVHAQNTTHPPTPVVGRPHWRAAQATSPS